MYIDQLNYMKTMSEAMEIYDTVAIKSFESLWSPH